MQKEKIKFAFFGTPQFAEIVLETLKQEGLLPRLIVTREDKPAGRHMVLTPPPVKVWAQKHNIPFIQPKSLKDPKLGFELRASSFEFFVVAAYGKIIPKEVFTIPRRGTLNIHPSLLPELRGASPIEGAILSENETGVTIIEIDEEMDHGPIVIQKKVAVSEWPPYFEELEKLLAEESARLLARVLPDWIEGKIKLIPQNHSLATFTEKISKEDGLIDLDDEPEKNLRKIRAFQHWPSAHFFIERKNKKIRIIVKAAELDSEGKLKITRLVPEGRKEISWEEFARGFLK
ncbi:methionyl-tRNA formyltransferase [Patescibacteria group bacterium]|nr:MAG: methionyl-tRNA formyltransferase [Patescibacteria group bacterium]